MTLPRPQLFGLFAGLFLAAGLVFSSMVGTSAWVKIKNSKLIRVKGSARKNITSDLAIWRGSFTVEAPTLLDAQRKLREDFNKVTLALSSRGFTNLNFSPIHIEEITATISTTNHTYTRREIAGYRLTQNVRVETDHVLVVTRLDEASTGLV